MGKESACSPHAFHARDAIATATVFGSRVAPGKPSAIRSVVGPKIGVACGLVDAPGFCSPRCGWYGTLGTQRR